MKKFTLSKKLFAVLTLNTGLSETLNGKSPMSDKKLYLGLTNIVIGFFLNHILLIFILWIIWSILYDQLTSLMMLAVLAFTPIWVIPFLFFCISGILIALLTSKISINVIILITSILTSLLVLFVLSNIKGLGPVDEPVNYPTMLHQEEIPSMGNHTIAYSLSIIYSITTYTTFHILRKRWIQMLS